MADIHDYLNASRDTDGALELLRAYCAQLEEGTVSDDIAVDTCLVLALAAAAVVAAIREASARSDYVTRDEADEARR